MKKKKITICISIIIILLLVVGISLFLFFTHQKQEDAEQEDVELPPDEILLISQYTNYAWGYQNNGVFLDSKGDLYSFDLAENSYNLLINATDAEFIKVLHTIRAKEKPFATISDSLLKELYWYISKININSTYTERHAAYDAGSDTLQIYDISSQKLILIHKTGDFEGALEDSYAQDLYSLYKKKVLPSIYLNTAKRQ